MGISITKRRRSDGTLRYRAQVRVIGQDALSMTFSRRAAAREWAEREQDRLRALRPGQSASLTLADAIDRYKREVLPGLKSSRTREVQIDWWREQLGDVALVDLSPGMIADKLQELAAGKSTHWKDPERRRTGATVNRFHAALSAVLRMTARGWHWIEQNPAHSVLRRQESRGRNRWLTDEERGRLLKACKASDWPGLHPLVLLALATGARKGELMGLTWDRVDLKRSSALLADTKNSQARTLPIRGPAVEALKEWSKVRRLDSPLVFPAPPEPKPEDPELAKLWKPGPPKPFYFRPQWEAARTAAELEDFRFHDLRHSAASYLAMNGASLVEIADILGHKTLQVVQRYAHLADAHKGAVLERMNAAVFGDS